MKNKYKKMIPVFAVPLIAGLLCFCSFTMSAQDCEEPVAILIDDDIDAYMTGDASSQATHWDMWPGATAGGQVSDEFASSGAQSIKVSGDIAGQDVLLKLGDPTSGHYLLTWEMYIPDGKEAYFNLQHEMPTSSAGFWGLDAIFNAGGIGELTIISPDPIAFSYPHDQWFTIILFLDIDSDEARLILDQHVIASWQFQNGVTNGGADYPSSGLNAINFYPINANNLFYVDNVAFAEIDAAGSGKYCYTAEAAVVGMNSVPELSCFGGAWDLDSDLSDGFAAHWFTYTAPANGVLSIGSCGGGADTRGWIFEGDCHNLVIKGVNDDQCDIGNGTSIWASYREAVVEANTTYYIMWDNIWETTGFEFELGFTEDAPEEGRFCESAIPVDIGEHLVTEMTGDAALAGPNINNTSSSTTAYSKSIWYVYTPDSTGVARATSCDGTTSDTYVFIYTGECGNFETLSLYALNDDSDSCAANQSYIEFDVEAGTDYYIEWIDRWSSDSFLWNLCFNGNCIPAPPVAVNELTLDKGLQD